MEKEAQEPELARAAETMLREEEEGDEGQME